MKISKIRFYQKLSEVTWEIKYMDGQTGSPFYELISSTVRKETT
jgi:hypothetical protein